MADYSQDKLIQALHAAHAAGDVAAARAIAQQLSGTQQTASGGAGTGAAGGSAGAGAQEPTEGLLTPDSGMLDKFKYGLANTGIESYLGAKQLFTNLDPEEMSVLKQSRKDVSAGGGAATAGRIVGGVGEAVAGSLATPAAIPAAIVKLAGAAAPYITGALGSAAQSAITTPIEDQDNKYLDKAKEGGKAALLSGALTALSRGGKDAITGMFKPTQDASTLMDNGITPTLQQGAEGKVGKFVGGLTSGTTDVAKRQEQELLDALTNKATAGKVNAQGATLAQRLAMIEQSIEQDYGSVLKGKTYPMNNGIRDAAMDATANIEKSGGRFTAESAEAQKLLGNIIGSDRNTTRLTSDNLRQNYLNAIQSAMGQTQSDRVKQALLEAKNVIEQNSQNSQLSSAELAALGDIKSRYFDFSRLREAASGAQRNETGVPVKDIANKYAHAMPDLQATNQTNEQIVGPALRVLGDTPRQDMARTLLVNAKRAVGLGTVGAGAVATGTAAPVAAALAPAYATSLLGQTRGGARFLFGQNDWQSKLKDALESPQTADPTLANVLRLLRDNSGGLGAALTQGEGNASQ